MPAKSQAQRKWAFGVKGKKWAEAHGYDNKGKLPARVGKKKSKKRVAKKKATRKPGKR